MKVSAIQPNRLSPMSYFLHSLLPLILGAFLCSIQQAHGAWDDTSANNSGSNPQKQGWRKVGDVTMEDLILSPQDKDELGL